MLGLVEQAGLDLVFLGKVPFELPSPLSHQLTSVLCPAG